LSCRIPPYKASVHPGKAKDTEKIRKLTQDGGIPYCERFYSRRTHPKGYGVPGAQRLLRNFIYVTDAPRGRGNGQKTVNTRPRGRKSRRGEKPRESVLLKQNGASGRGTHGREVRPRVTSSSHVEKTRLNEFGKRSSGKQEQSKIDAKRGEKRRERRRGIEKSDLGEGAAGAYLETRVGMHERPLGERHKGPAIKERQKEGREKRTGPFCLQPRPTRPEEVASRSVNDLKRQMLGGGRERT